MCNFLSVIVLKNGDVLHHPMLDSHSDLVAYFELPDSHAHHQYFAKAELTPVDWLDPATWKWRIDEDTRPGWLDDVEGQAEDKARSIVRRMIITDTTKLPKLIVDGCWIVGGAAKIRDVRGGRIVRIQDSAQVSNVGGSAQVSNVGGSAQVSNVGGSAQVSNVWGSAQVSNVWDSAQVSNVWGSAQVSNVWNSAQVSNVWDSAQVSNVGKAVVLDDSARARLVTAKAK